MLRQVMVTVLLFIVLLSPVYAQESNETTTSQTYILEVGTSAINPSELTINKGDKVDIRMLAGTRNVVFDDGKESGELSPGTSVKLTFDSVGTFTFQVENEASLSGTLTVVESGAPAPAPTEAEILAAGGETHYVIVQDFEYQPKNIIVALGDTIVWEHLGAVGHSVDFNDGQSRVINPNGNWNRTFTKLGEFGYVCRFHNAMKGTVTVVSKEEFADLDIEPTESTSTAQEILIDIVNDEFSKTIVTINEGDTVIWKNLDDKLHVFSSSNKVIDSKDLEKDQVYKKTFETPGTFDYTSELNEDMKGTIIVNRLIVEDELPEPEVVTPSVDESELDERLEELKEELTADMQALATSSGPAPNVQQFQTEMENMGSSISSLQSTVQSQSETLNTLNSDVQEMKQNVQSLESNVLTPPQIEIPEPQSPLMLYVSLAIDLVLVLIVLGLGVWMLRKVPESKLSSTGSSKVKVTDKLPKGKEGLSKGKPMPLPPKKGTKEIPKTLGEKKPAGIPDSVKPSNPSLDYLKKCRDRGMLDHQIVAEFVKSGWKEDDAKKLIAENP